MEGRLDAAFKSLLEYDKQSQMPEAFSDQLDLLYTRYKTIVADQRAGVLYYEQKSVEFAKVSQDLLGLTKEYRCDES